MFSRYEGAPVNIQIDCYNKNDQHSDPSTLVYVVVDKLTRQVMQSGTITSPSSVEEIEVSGANNVLLNQSHPSERRVVIVTANNEIRGIAEYDVLNARSIGVT